jgi:hypothetical protein
VRTDNKHTFSLCRASRCGIARLANGYPIERGGTDPEADGAGGDGLDALGPANRQENVRGSSFDANQVHGPGAPWPPSLRAGGGARRRLRREAGLCPVDYTRAGTAGRLGLRRWKRTLPLWVISGHAAPCPFMSAFGVIADIGKGLIRNRDLNVRYWG